MDASGSFTVQLKPLDAYATESPGGTLGRMSIDKAFTGDLDATSQGEMLTGMTAVQGSAGYVAIEKVTGTLGGKSGSFILQHFGIMDGEQSRLILEVVPQSGTEALTGLTGSMTIDRSEGSHKYRFTYDL